MAFAVLHEELYNQFASNIVTKRAISRVNFILTAQNLNRLSLWARGIVIELRTKEEVNTIMNLGRIRITLLIPGKKPSFFKGN